MKFLTSASALDLSMFLVETQKSVKGTRMTDTQVPDRIKPLMDWIDKIELWLEEVPPVDQPMRFGNKAFRTWMDRIIAAADEDLNIIGSAGNPDKKHFSRAVPELKGYLLDSLGSYERID